jgi:hypothetical protein
VGAGRGSHCLRGGSWSSGPPCECPLAPPPTCRLPLEAACTCPRSTLRIRRGGTPAAGVAPFSLRVWAKQSWLLTSNRARAGEGRGGGRGKRGAGLWFSRGLQKLTTVAASIRAAAGIRGTQGKYSPGDWRAGTEEAAPPTTIPNHAQCYHNVSHETHAQPFSACPKLPGQRIWPRKWLVVSAPALLHATFPPLRQGS